MAGRFVVAVVEVYAVIGCVNQESLLSPCNQSGRLVSLVVERVCGGRSRRTIDGGLKVADSRVFGE